MWRMAASGGLDMDGTKGVRQCVVDIGFQHSKGPSSIHESGFTRTYLAGPPIQAILPVSLARHFLLELDAPFPPMVGYVYETRTTLDNL